MIVGIGFDLVEIERMARALEQHGGRFEAKLFTAAERQYCDASALRAQHYAARFAAKEAWLKAMGVPRGLEWHQLEVVSERGQAPRFLTYKAAERVSADRGIARVFLSLTHTGRDAAAMIVLEGAST